MTSVYHRRFYPDDLVGTVAYVAPHSMGTSDPRYLDFVAEVGDAGCRAALAAWQVELLERREAMIERMVAQAPNVTYDLLGARRGLRDGGAQGGPSPSGSTSRRTCARRCPSPGASDNEVWDFLELAASTGLWSDGYTLFYEPYYWQAAVQLGYPALTETHLAGLLEYPGNDVPASYVLPGPARRQSSIPGSMPDVSAWMASEGERLMFIYGENDPYSAAAFDPAGAVDAHRFYEPGGNHAASFSRSRRCRPSGGARHPRSVDGRGTAGAAAARAGLARRSNSMEWVPPHAARAGSRPAEPLTDGQTAALTRSRRR